MSRLGPILILLISISLIVLHRMWWFDLPLERDISTYAVIARGLLEGRPLYSDLWDHKPPGIHIIYALGAFTFGSHQTGIALIGVALAIATLVVIWVTTKELTGNRLAPIIVSSLGYALIQSDLFLEALQPNTEAGINLCIAMALLAILRLKTNPRSLIALSTLALVTLAASLFKHIAVIPIALCVLGLLPMQQWFKVLIVALICLVTGWAALLTTVPGAYEALIVFNRLYSGSIPENLAQGITLGRLIPRCSLPLITLVALGVFGFRKNLWLVAGLVGVWTAVSLPGRFYNHYYQLYIPFLCLAAAIGTHELLKYRPTLGKFLSIASLSLLLFYQLAFIAAFTPDSFSIKRHSGLYVNSRMLGEKLKTEQVDFELVGDSTGVLFYSEAAPRSGFVYTLPRNAAQFTANQDIKLTSDLSSSRPAVIVSEVSNPLFSSLAASSPLSIFINEHYAGCSPFHELAILARKDLACPNL